jgi:alkylation response protein AidB-like acyl-CoA dehydrogenase
VSFTPEHEELRQAVRRFLAKHSTESEVRRLMDSENGFDQAVWTQLAEMGLTGLAIPEEHGGAGAGWVEVGIVLEEAGRALLCAPYLSTVVLATAALLACGDTEAANGYLPRIADGSLTATVAVTEDQGSPDEPKLAAVLKAGAWQLSGDRSFVIDGGTAGLLLVAARTARGIGLFAVDADAPGIARTPLPTLDLTRKQARLTFDRTPARLLGSGERGAAVLARVGDLAAVGLAAEHVGGAARALELSVNHAKTRYQFGRPIGSFQAIKHMCADMLVDVECARSAAYHAMWAADNDPDELPIAASLAKAHCSDAFFRVAAQTIQVHGGIGFTWEHPAHLYLKRAKTGQLLFGDSMHHRTLLARRLGI